MKASKLESLLLTIAFGLIAGTLAYALELYIEHAELENEAMRTHQELETVSNGTDSA